MKKGEKSGFFTKRLAEAIGELLKVDKQINRCYVYDLVYRMTLYTKREFISQADFLALLWICLQSLCTKSNVGPADWEKVLVCTIIWIDKMHIEYGHHTVWELLPWYYSDKQIKRFDIQSLTYIRFFPGLVTSECLRDVKQQIHELEIPKVVVCKSYDDEDAVMVCLMCDEIMMY